jgi:hypothetical protein
MSEDDVKDMAMDMDWLPECPGYYGDWGYRMYDNVKYLGCSLKEWQEKLHNTYSLGELYRMMQEHVDFNALISK